MFRVDSSVLMKSSTAEANHACPSNNLSINVRTNMVAKLDLLSPLLRDSARELESFGVNVPVLKNGTMCMGSEPMIVLA